MSKRQGNDVFTGDGGSPDGSMAGGWTGQRGDVMRDEFGLEIPIENIPLPSQGRVYPEGHPLHMQETVQIRAMTAREEDILTSKALIKKGTVITELIRSCLINKRIDPNDLLTGDRNALMVALRITGYGAEYSVEVSCPHCQEKSKQDFDLSSLPIKNFTTSPVAEGSNVFEAKLDDGNVAVRYRFMNGNDELEMAQMQERKKKQGFVADNLITTRYSKQLVAVNDITDKTKLQMFVQKMPAKLSMQLRKEMDANEPGIEMKQWMECPSCMESSEVTMPLGASFFWPDA